MTSYRNLGAAHALAKLGMNPSNLDELADPAFSILQNAGLEAAKSDEDTRWQSAAMGGAQSGMAVTLDELPWKRMFQGGIRQLLRDPRDYYHLVRYPSTAV